MGQGNAHLIAAGQATIAILMCSYDPQIRILICHQSVVRRVKAF
jgi:hypothetical protein